MPFAHLLDLLAFMVPAYSANMAPPFLRFWKGWIPFDQLDFQIGALLLAGHSARLSGADVALILLLGFAGHLTVNRIAWWLKIKDTKW